MNDKYYDEVLINERAWYPGKQKTREDLYLETICKLHARVRELEKQVSDQSWIINPDRMGGQFTQQEIDDANRW